MSGVVAYNAGGGAVDQWLVQFGDVSVSRHWVGTPYGSQPLRGTYFTVADYSRVESRIPAWAIVLAILFFPLGLLFLLVRTPVVVGQINVTVQNGAFVHVTQLPVLHPMAAADIHARVNYARQLSAGA